MKANLHWHISTSTGILKQEMMWKKWNTLGRYCKDTVIIISGSKYSDGLVEYADNITVTSGVYEPSFQLNQTGSYNVLVILNPLCRYSK